jgi:hypothetical protein
MADATDTVSLFLKLRAVALGTAWHFKALALTAAVSDDACRSGCVFVVCLSVWRRQLTQL